MVFSSMIRMFVLLQRVMDVNITNKTQLNFFDCAQFLKTLQNWI